jgi:putative redox protein
MEVQVTHLGNVRFNVQARNHSLICDQPAENKGDDSGMTPPELMLAALASCAGYYAVEYLKTRGLTETGVRVSVKADKLKGPARLGNFIVQVRCPVALTEEQTLALTRSVERCLIHNTLLNPPQITLEIEQPE